MAKYDKKFQAWCLSVEQGSPPVTRFNEFERKERRQAESNGQETPSQETILNGFINSVTQETSPISIDIDSGHSFQSSRFDFFHILPAVVEGKSSTPINNFIIRGSLVETTIKNAVIRRLSTQDHYRRIFLEKCNIRELRVDGKFRTDLTLKDCRIGRLFILLPESINSLEVSGGEIHSVECPAANTENPFTGSVSFKDTRFPISKEESKLFSDKQQFHNLRHHLEKLENTFEAQKMRALELAAERKDEAFTNWVLSWYQYISTNYGLSPGHPLLAAVSLYFLMVFLTFLFGWAVLEARTPSEFYDTAWRVILKDEYASCHWIWGAMQQCGNWPRAWLLPGQYILNPFGIFGTQSLLVAKSGWINIVLTFSGLFCDILIATGFLAIRKRFKLN